MWSVAIGNPTGGDGEPSDPASALTEAQRAALKSHLHQGEEILWEGRGIPRPYPGVRVFPSFFAAFLCSLSGFALMGMFGILGDRRVGAGLKLLLLGLPPAALGAACLLGMAWSVASHVIRQGRIGRSFYVLTDRRAIAAQEHPGGEVSFCPWTPNLFDDTRLIELGDGTGSVYFLRDGDVLAPHRGFENIREAGRVAALIREVVLGEKPPAGPELQEL